MNDELYISYELHISYHFEKLFYLKTNNVIMHHLLFIFLSHDFVIPTQNLVGEGSEAHPFQVPLIQTHRIFSLQQELRVETEKEERRHINKMESEAQVEARVRHVGL